jgi:rhodanese-related sulfurtransferase
MYTDIDLETYLADFADKIGTEYQLIDVREIDEYTEGHLPNATNIPLSILEQHSSAVSKETPVVLVCARGGRSAMAAEYLASIGYTGLYNLEGGTLNYIMQGHPIEKPQCMLTPFLRDNPQDAISYNIEELRSTLNQQAPTEQVRTLGLIATVHRIRREFEPAIQTFQQAIQLAHALGDERAIATNQLRLAIAYQYRGDEKQSIALFKEVLPKLESLDHQLDFGFQHWGKFLVEQGQVRAGLVFLERALAMRKVAGNAELIASSEKAVNEARKLLKS